MKIRNISGRKCFTDKGALMPDAVVETTTDIGKRMVDLKLAEEIKPKRKTRSDKGTKRARPSEDKQQNVETDPE